MIPPNDDNFLTTAPFDGNENHNTSPTTSVQLALGLIALQVLGVVVVTLTLKQYLFYLLIFFVSSFIPILILFSLLMVGVLYYKMKRAGVFLMGVLYIGVISTNYNLFLEALQEKNEATIYGTAFLILNLMILLLGIFNFKKMN
jgi:hypothetical protein